MDRSPAPRQLRASRLVFLFQLFFGATVLVLAFASLYRFNSIGIFLHMDGSDVCRRFHAARIGYADFDLRALSDRVDEVLGQLAALQEKLDSSIQRIDRDRTLRAQNISNADFRRFLDEEVAQPLYTAHVGLRLIRLPRPDAGSSREVPVEDPLVNFFTVEETRKYLAGKENRAGKLSIHGANRTYGTIGHACVLMKEELEEYMNYDVGSYCKDDWLLGQRLMIGGCDPLPRRRCLSRASRLYQHPYAINESLWRLPDDRNVRWNSYACRNFACLSSKNPRRGFSKCTGCFEMEKEKLKWAAGNASGQRAEFSVGEVLAVKPGGIRIGLDVSVGTGSFAARMRERNVTIVSTALNVGAPFSETIALRGLVPLYITLNQRLPFFDNTLDLIHTTVFLDGWIDLQLLDFVLFDWDRVLRPGGLLWIDKFFCHRKDLDDYMYMFLQFRYRKHRWVISPKSKDEVYLSALLEKPPRSL